MISSQKIIKDFLNTNPHLFKNFLLKTKYDFNENKLKNFQKFKTVIMIGMGGSILGAKAIYSFLKHGIDKKFIFVDNLDTNHLLKIKRENKLKSSLFIIISKSGNTTETIINSSFFNLYLKKTNTIIISENKNNALRNFAKKRDIYFVKHQQNVGGRYSVFSEVGMLPAYFMGLRANNFKTDVSKIQKNKKILSKLIKKIHKMSVKKNKTLILFNYVPELNNFMYWCQQLFAESLGKNKKGFIPVISNAPKDHHSLLQLYLDGPKDKFFYIFSSKNIKKIKIKSLHFGKNFKYLNKKSFDLVKISQKNAFVKALKEKKISFREFQIKEFNENTIGKLFFLFIFETIVYSKILAVNPFDQPAVERVKILTKKILTS